MSSIIAPEGMVPVSEFSKLKNIPEDKVVNMIRDGFYVGKIIEEQWFVSSEENATVSSSSDSKQNKYQLDVNKALSAISVGSSLSILNSILHVIAFILLFAFSSQLGIYGVVYTILIGIGLMLSWAITYSILSIVVTNALTAKHAIIQTSKI
jgi:hypothetical protein